MPDTYSHKLWMSFSFFKKQTNNLKKTEEKKITEIVQERKVINKK